MTILIIALIVLGLFSALLGYISHRKGENEEIVAAAPTCATCDGTASSRCEQECMMEAATKEIDYFDDEELDAYKGRPAEDYTDQEVEQFAEVLYTMKPHEVAAWNRSLILRGINMPNQLKDEVIAFIASTPGETSQS